MSSLDNSKRTLYKATYVPTKSSSGDSQQTTSRVVEKVAFLRMLNPQPNELTLLGQHAAAKQLMASFDAHQADGAAAKQTIPLVELTKNLVIKTTPAATRENARFLANAGGADLVTLGQALTEIRQKAADAIRSLVIQIEEKYQEAHQESALTRDPTFIDMATWASDPKNSCDAFKELHTLALSQYDPQSDDYLLALAMNPVSLVVTTVNNLIQSPAQTSAQVDIFRERYQVIPVGRLHLERMEMTPVGIEHGELIHSVPLTPKETVNITHREWSVTSRTFEDIVQDSFEGFSETGVTEKTDLTQATDNESRHTSSLDVNGSVSASYNGGAYSVTASAAVDYNTTSDDLRSVKTSLAHSQAITKNASSRARKDHKISFRVSSVAGAEDLSVRVLTNPSDTDAMRVDYYQLLRKWRVDLIRYGLRMTYDIVVPNPGRELVEKVLELDQLKQEAAQPDPEYSFPVQLNEIDSSSWQNLAKQYDVEVDAPPAPPHKMIQVANLQKSDTNWIYATMEVDVLDGYVITGPSFVYAQWSNVGHAAQFHVWGENFDPTKSSPLDPTNPVQFADSPAAVYYPLTTATLIGETGRVSFVYDHYNIDHGEVEAIIQIAPTDDSMKAWQLKVWNTLREAGLNAFNTHLKNLQDTRAQRITQLQDEIANYDALTLRKMEREAIMKSVLQWLFGPTFKLVPDNIQSIFDWLDFFNPQQTDLASLSINEWRTIMEYGENIRFIHNAIEWENVIFFGYPYFWDSLKNWPFKRFLVHPDPEHRQFLRAGCARVVLTIRPGFEKDFANFLESWDTGKPVAGDDPYVSIGNEIRNFAMTNYEAIPPANPDNNVRLLLYPEQQKTWSDMQKLIALLGDYNLTQHQRLLSTPVAATGVQAVTPTLLTGALPPTAMTDIVAGAMLTVDSRDNQETVTVISTSPTDFTAYFGKTHAAGVTIQLDPNVNTLYPSSLDALKPTTDIPQVPPTDSWGQPFYYKCPGLNGDYDLASYGRNGKPGYSSPPMADYPPDLDADITSWAEGTVIARWHEYTPTSAMDVEINTKLPTNPQAA